MKAERQNTIAAEVSVNGIGLHSGKPVHMQLVPVSANTGIVFQRTDLTNGASTVLSHFSNVVDVDHSTNLGNRRGGTIVRTIEHLMAVFNAFGIDNVIVRLDGPEVPIVDGSSIEIARAIERVGLRELPFMREHLVIKHPVEYRDGERFIRVSPAKKLQLTYHIDFPNALIGKQSLSISLNRQTFLKDIAPARTFCMLHEVQWLQSNGMALGGSLDNAIVVAEDRILNESLRFSDEFVRHKVLDLVGDLFLLGRPLVGHVEVWKGGHNLHTRFLREILSHPESYRIERSGVNQSPGFTHYQASPVFPGTDLVDAFPQTYQTI